MHIDSRQIQRLASSDVLCNAHPITFDVNVRKVSDEAERSPLWMVSVNWNWSKFCLRNVAGNATTGNEVGTSRWKQELAMELTGLHVQLKLRRENQTVSSVELS